MTTPKNLASSTIERLWEGVFPQIPGESVMIFPDRLPENLPLKIPVPDQTTIVGSAIRPLSMTIVLFETVLSASAVREFYDRAFAKQGWQKHREPTTDDEEVVTGGSFLEVYMTDPALNLDSESWVYRCPGIDQAISLSLSLNEVSATTPQAFSLTFLACTERSNAAADQSQIDDWMETDFEDFYARTTFPPDLSLPDLESVAGIQLVNESASESDREWQIRFQARSRFSQSDILAAYAEQLQRAGWHQQSTSASTLLAHQIWQHQDNNGQQWEFAYYLLEANSIADRLIFWGKPPLPEAPGKIHHHIGEISIHQIRSDSYPVQRPTNQLPLTVPSRFADLLLGDYRLGELPDGWPETFLVPLGSTIVISRGHHRENQIVLNVPLRPSETEALYHRTLLEQGWQPLCFAPQRLASGLPQDADFQMYMRGNQQLTYSIRSFDRTGQSDVRLNLVERSGSVLRTVIEWIDKDTANIVPVESEELLPDVWSDYPSPTFPLPLLHMPLGVKCFGTGTTVKEGQLLQQAKLTAPRGFGDLHQQLAIQLSAAGCHQVAIEQLDGISMSRWHVSDRPGVQWQIDILLLSDSRTTGRIILRCDVLGR